MKNVAVSVRAKLLNLSRSSGQPLASLMELYVTGRLLYRLSLSEYRERFILKGAQLFHLWQADIHRPTRDLDFLGFGDPSEKAIQKIFTTIVRLPVDIDDGLEWGEVSTKLIRDGMDYGGVRAILKVKLAGAHINLQVDVGFGDAITPSAIQGQWTELLGFPAAHLLAYPPETVIAEKFQAMVELGINNSRMKDFFDVDWLFQHQTFDSKTLRSAIDATFDRRNTILPTEPPLALTSAFAQDSQKITQWNAFLRKNNLHADSLDCVIQRLEQFLSPILFTKQPDS
jgi:hypothetical protein